MSNKPKPKVWRGSYFPPGYFPDGSIAAARDRPKGGRPSSPYAAEWLRLFKAEKAKKKRTNEAVYNAIANKWRDPAGKPRAWTTIRDGILRAKK